MSGFRLDKIFSTIAHSYLPALIIAVTVWYAYFVQNFDSSDLLLWRRLFYAFCFGTILFLMFVNRTKPLFLTVLIMTAYVSYQHLFSADVPIRNSGVFLLIFCLFPITALILDFHTDLHLFSSENNFLLTGLLVEGVLVEKAGWLLTPVADILFWIGCAVWVIVLMWLLIRLSHTGGIKDNGRLYALVSVFIGFLNADSPAVLTLYFSSSALCLLFSTLEEYLYALVRDPLTGVSSRFYYEWKSQKSFPLKYCLGLVCIDNYDKLLKAFGERKTDRLVWLLVGILKGVSDRAGIYRLAPDEFVLVFYEDDQKQTYEYLEELRRTIAGTVFELQKNAKTKVTISAGVSEKKRSDANAEVVLQRIREAVRRAYKFTQNVTSKV